MRPGPTAGDPWTEFAEEGRRIARAALDGRFDRVEEGLRKRDELARRIQATRARRPESYRDDGISTLACQLAQVRHDLDAIDRARNALLAGAVGPYSL